MDPSNGSNGSNGSDPDVHRGGLKEGLFWGRSVFPEKLDIFWKKVCFFSTKPIFFLQIISPLLCFLSPKFEN